MSTTPADAIAYPPPARIAAAALTVVAKGSPLLLLVLLFFFDTPLQNQLRLIRVFTAVCLVPTIAASLLRRAFAATAAVNEEAVIVQRRAERVEAPRGAIAAVEPWTVPLPEAGVSLRLRSGKRLRYGLAVADPVALIDALAAAAPRRDAPGYRTALYARAKSAARRWWQHPLFKYVAFALAPTVPLFRLHQWIAYGGTFGEYYTYGLQAYLLAFAIYWATTIISLVLYASALRAVAEPIAFVSAHIAPGHAATARIAIERTVAILYFGGVPLFLVIRFVLS
jgi:apolipoprotein N-acyltransferase